MAKRYIDADELELEYYDLSIHGTMAVKSVLPIFTDLLEKQPTADVAEVVRCEKCKYRKIHTCAITGTETLFCDCGNTPVIVELTHFCGYGVRRKDDEVRE